MIFKDDKNDYFDGPDIQDEPRKPKAPELKPEDPDYWEQSESEFEHLRPRRPWVLWGYIALAGIAIGLAVGVYLRYFSPYVSEATQYGYVEEIEKRGTVFNTYEGILIPYKEIMDTTRVYRNDFVFSVTDPSVAVALRRLQYANLPVRVEYKRFHATLPWRGESRIVVVRADTADPAKILPPEFTPDVK